MRIPFYGEVEEHELGMLHPEEQEFAKVIFPRNLEAALDYRHMLGAVYLLHRGFPCFRTKNPDFGSFIIGRSRLWTAQYKVPEQYWAVVDVRKECVREFSQIEEVLWYLKEKL